MKRNALNIIEPPYVQFLRSPCCCPLLKIKRQSLHGRISFPLLRFHLPIRRCRTISAKLTAFRSCARLQGGYVTALARPLEPVGDADLFILLMG